MVARSRMLVYVIFLKLHLITERGCHCWFQLAESTYHWVKAP